MSTGLRRLDDIFFSDIDVNFEQNSINDDVVFRKNEDAVKRAIINLLLTNKGDRVLRPQMGSNIRYLLFENHSPFITYILEQEIRDTIITYEPRCRLVNVRVTPNPDSNAYDIFVEFNLINQTTTSDFQFILERSR